MPPTTMAAATNMKQNRTRLSLKEKFLNLSANIGTSLTNIQQENVMSNTLVAAKMGVGRRDCPFSLR